MGSAREATTAGRHLGHNEIERSQRPDSGH